MVFNKKSYRKPFIKYSQVICVCVCVSMLENLHTVNKTSFNKVLPGCWSITTNQTIGFIYVVYPRMRKRASYINVHNDVDIYQYYFYNAKKNTQTFYLKQGPRLA